MEEGVFVIKVQATSDFNFSSMNKITNLKRKSIEKDNYIFKGDIFECDKEMYEYLTGKNEGGYVVVKLIEYKPSKK